MDQIPGAELGRSFHLFSRLPVELRWKIWDYNLPGQRVVSIQCGSESLSPDDAARQQRGCTSSTRIPSNLHACHESRREALRRYRLSFGVAGAPGKIFFDPNNDVLYFGPRDGFMASEAQLRTFLSLCDPAELAGVRRVAVNDALFWVYEHAWAGGGGGGGARAQGAEDQTGALTTTDGTVAASLLTDVLQLLQSRLPGLEELVFTPRDENPLYSEACCLVEPAILQSRMARQIKEAMHIVFPGRELPWRWRIMTLSADPNPPVYGRGVLGWSSEGADDAGHRGSDGTRSLHEVKVWESRNMTTRLSVLQESVRKQFMQMEMGVCG